MKQSTRHIMVMEPVGFHSNPETKETNTYQFDDPSDLATVQRNAVLEFRRFRDILVDHGVFVTTIKGQAASPDDIFCNNWVSTLGDGTLVYYPMLAPNRQIERRPEIMKMLEDRYKVALDLSAYEREGRYLESTGSLWIDRVNKIVYSALSPRTDEGLAKLWCEKLGYELVTFNTRNHAGKPVYHTDVMMFIGTGYVGICAECILESDRARVLSKFSQTHEVIELTLPQLQSFCGNALELLGENNEPMLVMSKSAYQALTQAQITAFLKYVEKIIFADIQTIEKYGGGSARCMLLELH
jgi:hypothetical protein